jgi:hypothetical protein
MLSAFATSSVVLGSLSEIGVCSWQQIVDESLEQDDRSDYP